MTVTAAQVVATTGQLSRVASWLEQAGVEHAEGIARTRGTLAALPSRWSGPASQETVETGRHLIERAAPVGGELRCAVGDLRRTVEQGMPVADALRFLERQEEDLLAEVFATTARAAGEADPLLAASASRRATELQEELRRVQRRRSEQQQVWLDVCRRAAGSISEAAGRIRAANGPLELRATAVPAHRGGGAGEGSLVDRLRERLRYLERVGSRFGDAFEAYDLVTEEMFARATAWRKAVRRTVVAKVREARVVVGGVAFQQLEFLIRVRRLDHLVRGSAPGWLAAARRYAGAIGPGVRAVTQRVPALTGLFAGWERWEKDQQRSDLTCTERWLRAGFEGFTRGFTTASIGKATLALAGGGAKLLPGLGLAAVPVIFVAGALAAIAIDKSLERSFDKVFDEWEWSQSAFRWTADAIDDVGRALRPAVEAVRDAGAMVWGQASDTWRAAEERWAQLSDDVHRLRQRVGDRAESTADDIGTAAWNSGDQIREGWEQVSQGANQQVERVQGRVGSVVQVFGSTADETWSKAEERWSQMTDTWQQGIRRHYRLEFPEALPWSD